MTTAISLVTRIDAPREVVFDLSLSIDVHLESMRDSRERAVGGVTSGPIGLGESVTWRATHFHIPFTMKSRITGLERPSRFVDEQVRGPFRTFRHEHRFEAAGDTTVMRDVIEFSAPLGALGGALERLVLARYIRRLTEVRNAHIKERAEHGTW